MCIRDRFGALQHEAIAPDDASVPHHEDLHGGVAGARILGHGDVVEILQRRQDDLLLLGDALRRLEPVAVKRSQLELQVFGGAAHLLLELAQHLVAVAFEELHQLLDGLAVFVTLSLIHI